MFYGPRPDSPDQELRRRVPDLFRRNVATPPGDFVTRGEVLLELEWALEWVVVEALEHEGAVEDAGNRDGLNVETIFTASRSLEFDGGLSMLGPMTRGAGSGGRYVPVHGTVCLTEDLSSVASYELKIGATIREGLVVPSTPETPEEWLIIRFARLP